MELIKRRLMAYVVTLMLGFAPVAASASEVFDDQVTNRPTAMAMTADAIFARPALLAGTIVGTAVFIVSLPFSLIGGNVGEAAKTLVVGPAKSTFTRCLGCTETQNKWKDTGIVE